MKVLTSAEAFFVCFVLIAVDLSGLYADRRLYGHFRVIGIIDLSVALILLILVSIVAYKRRKKPKKN